MHNDTSNFVGFEVDGRDQPKKREQAELRRKHHTQNTIPEMLPVVELRPFSRHLWRRERSLAEFYKKSADTNDESDGRNPSQDCLPHIVGVISEISGPTDKCSDHCLIRTRKKIHPKVCTNVVPLIDHKQRGILPGFIAKDDRSKTTLFWSRQDENPKSYSCRKQALNSATVRRHQEIQLHGGPLSIPEKHQNQFVYLNPLEYYKQKSTHNQIYHRKSQQKHNSAPSDTRQKQLSALSCEAVNIIGLLERGSPRPRLSPITTFRKRSVKEMGSEKVAANLWRNGKKHSIIERKLDEERTFHIRQCRRTIDIGFSTLDILQHLQKQDMLDTTLTQGEILLKRGKEANTMKFNVGLETGIVCPVKEDIKPSIILSIRRCRPDPIFVRKHNKTGIKLLNLKAPKLSESDVKSERTKYYDSKHQESVDSRVSYGDDLLNKNINAETFQNAVRDVFSEPSEDSEYSSASKCTQVSDVAVQDVGNTNNNTPLIDLVAQVNSNVILIDAPAVCSDLSTGLFVNVRRCVSPSVTTNNQVTPKSLVTSVDAMNQADLCQSAPTLIITNDLKRDTNKLNTSDSSNADSITEPENSFEKSEKELIFSDVKGQYEDIVDRNCLKEADTTLLPSTTFITTNV